MSFARSTPHQTKAWLLSNPSSDSQREQLSALLDDIYAGFSADVASSRGKTEAEVSWCKGKGGKCYLCCMW